MKAPGHDQNKIIGALKKCKIFTGLTDEEMIKISTLFETLDFSNGEFIFMEGDPSDWLYIVTQKRVKIVMDTKSGKEILLEIKSPGEMFCCATVLDNKPYPESAQAKGPAAVIRISRANFLKITGAYPFLKASITKYLNDKLTDAYDMLKNISTEIVERRIASVLLKLSEKTGVAGSEYSKIDFPLTRQEIGDMVGTTLETSIRTMSKFQKQGLVKSSRTHILVKTEAVKNFLEK
jgi:CRP/FNR family transcriptional regulator